MVATTPCDDIHNLNHYKAIIFDLDGTLYFRKGINKKIALSLLFSLPTLVSYQKARKKLFSVDCDSSKQYNLKLHSFAAENRFSKEKRKFDLEKRAANGENWYNKKFYPVFYKILKKYYKAEPFVSNLLAKINEQKIPMICYSDYSYVKERLEAIGIDPGLFTILLSSEDEGVLKPSARPILELCDSMDIHPSEILIVGDRTDTDGETARLAGTDYYRILDQNGKKDYYISWHELLLKLEEN